MGLYEDRISVVSGYGLNLSSQDFENFVFNDYEEEETVDLFEDLKNLYKF